MLKLRRVELKSYLTKSNVVFICFISLPIMLALIFLLTDDSDEFVRLGKMNYQTSALKKRCPPGSKTGAAGASYGYSSREGIKYNVRTPLNYNAEIAHKLLMVYAPAKANRMRSEALTKLTYAATTAGFIVAYADHPELSTTSTIELGTIPALIAKDWCIDQNHVYLTGHSDGGTVSMALAFMTGTRDIPRAIAASAAGVNYQALKDRSCPKPISVMVMHSSNDHLFPGYGEESSGWWAACNQCSPIPDKLENGCFAYRDCAKNVKTWYCPGKKLHAKWPDINNTLIDFFISSGN